MERRKKAGRKGSHNLAINRGVLLLIFVFQIPEKQSKFWWELRDKNILKHVVKLREHLAPQYGYYGFALLRNIYRNYVFGVLVRENYLWECGCNNFPHSEYFFFGCLLTTTVIFLHIWSFSRKSYVVWLVYSPFNFSVNLLLDKLLEVILEGNLIS